MSKGSGFGKSPRGGFKQPGLPGRPGEGKRTAKKKGRQPRTILERPMFGHNPETCGGVTARYDQNSGRVYLQIKNIGANITLEVGNATPEKALKALRKTMENMNDNEKRELENDVRAVFSKLSQEQRPTEPRTSRQRDVFAVRKRPVVRQPIERTAISYIEKTLPVSVINFRSVDVKIEGGEAIINLPSGPVREVKLSVADLKGKNMAEILGSRKPGFVMNDKNLNTAFDDAVRCLQIISDERGFDVRRIDEAKKQVALEKAKKNAGIIGLLFRGDPNWLNVKIGSGKTQIKINPKTGKIIEGTVSDLPDNLKHDLEIVVADWLNMRKRN